MKLVIKHIIFSVAFFLPLIANGQDISIRQEKKEDSTVDLELQRYDGSAPFFDIQILKDCPHYYDGCKILFLPCIAPKYDLIDGFTLPKEEMAPSLNDTTWNKAHTVIRRIKQRKSNVYKPREAIVEPVRNWTTDSFDMSGEVKDEYGIFTEREAIEGHIFTIINCEVSTEQKIYSTYHTFKIGLLDQDGKELFWTFTRWLYGKDYRFMPVIMPSYIDTYKRFVGQSFVFANGYSKNHASYVFPLKEEVYQCTELCYIADRVIHDHPSIGAYYSPVLIFQKDGKECHYDVIQKKNHFSTTCYQSISQGVFEDLVPFDKFYADKAIAQENYRQKVIADSIATANRLAEEQAEKERLEELRKRQQRESAQRRQLEKEKQEAEQAAAAQARYDRLKLEYGEETANLILRGNVRIGWSSQMCREAWGAPREVSRTTTANGVHEQWVYSKGHLFFDNGILTTIMD